MSERERPELKTAIGSADRDRIFVRGKDLVEEVIGHLTFSQMIFLMISGRMPERNEEEMLDACLVSLVDHGLTLSAVVTRANYSVAPEAIQGAVAAGLLGVGSVFAGTMEGCGEVLDRLAHEVDGGKPAEEAAAALVASYRAAGRHVPGIGHRTHTTADPRADRLLDLAEEKGLGGRYVKLLRLLGEEVRKQTGRQLPINVTGAIGAVLMEMGFEWQILRGFALISRCAGLVAHVREERTAPVVPALRQLLAEGGRG